MNAKRLIAVTLMALAIPTVALARPSDDGRQRRSGPQAGPPITQIARHLAQQLDMTADQKEQLNQIVTAHEDEFAANQDQREQMRELHQQLREARRAGDDEQAEDLKAQIDELREGRHELMEAFLADVEAILTDDQKDQFAQMQERMQQRRGERGPDGKRGEHRQRGPKGERGKMERHGKGPEGKQNLHQLIKVLPEALELTDEQKSQYDELVADIKEKMKAHRETMAELRPLINEMREARRAGDDERVAEIKEELDSKRPERGELHEEFKTGLDAILTDIQKEKLEKMMAKRGQGGPDRLMGALRHVDLTEEQEAEIKKIMDKAHEDIMALLTPEQKEKLEQMKKDRPRDGRGQKEKADKGKRHGDREGKRGQRGDRGSRGGRGQHRGSQE